MFSEKVKKKKQRIVGDSRGIESAEIEKGRGYCKASVVQVSLT